MSDDVKRLEETDRLLTCGWGKLIGMGTPGETLPCDRVAVAALTMQAGEQEWEVPLCDPHLKQTVVEFH